jgi:hypothetical protein
MLRLTTTRCTSLTVALILMASSAIRAADGPKVTYQDHILPLMREKCSSCHDQEKKKGGLNVLNYTALMQGGSTGQVVKPGDPDDSRFMLLLAHKEKPFMPPESPPLPEATLTLVRQWIVGGALETIGSKPAPAKPKVDISLTSIIKGKPDGPPPMPEKPLPIEPLVKVARANAITALAANPWSPLVAVAGEKQIVLYNVDTLELVGLLPFPEGVPHVLRFSRNGSMLLAAGGHAAKSGKAVVWNVKTGERIVEVGDELDAVLAADISSDQTQIALGGSSKMIRVYSTKDGTLIREIKKHTDWIYHVEYSPDSVLLATSDRNGGVFVWESFTGREYFSLRGHSAAVTGISWRTDSNVLATCSEDGTVRLWEMENGGPIKNWAHGGGGVQSVQFARDNRIVSSGRDRTVKLWDANGAALRAFEAMPDVAMRCAVSHDGSRVIAGDWSGRVKVWNAADGKLLGELSANPPGLAERLDAATKDTAARQTAFDQATAAASASQAAAQKAVANLAAAQKTVTDTAAAAKAAQDNVAKMKAIVDQMTAALAAAQSNVAARDLLSRSFAEAAAKVTDAAAKAPTNKELAAAAARGKELATLAAAELAAAQKAVTDTTAALAKATADHNAAQQVYTQAAATAAAAPKLVETATAAVAAANAKAAADKAAVDAALAALNNSKSQIEKLKAAVASRPSTK